MGLLEGEYCTMNDREMGIALAQKRKLLKSEGLEGDFLQAELHAYRIELGLVESVYDGVNRVEVRKIAPERAKSEKPSSYIRGHVHCDRRKWAIDPKDGKAFPMSEAMGFSRPRRWE